MLEVLTEIDSVRLNFSTDGKLLLNAAIAFIMFGVALELSPRDFKKLLRQPKPALVGILSQFLLMPLLTFGIAMAIGDFITPTIGLGMVLVAACPGGNISNFISSLARGNVALSVSLTAFSSVGGMILTPLNFAFWGNLYLKFQKTTATLPELQIEVWSVLQTIVIILGLPLVCGLLFNARFPKLTQKLIVHIKRASILVFFAMIAVIFAKNYELFLRYIQYIFLVVLVHNALAFIMGYWTGKAFRLKKQDCRTISIETGIQNSGLALALLFNPAIFPEDMAIGGMAFIAAWWGVWHIISGLSLASVWSGFSLRPKEEAQAT